MSHKVSLRIPKNMHQKTKELIEELEKIIPHSHITDKHGGEDILVDIIQDVLPQYIVFKTSAAQFVFKINEYKSRKVLGCKSDIIKEDSQLVLNNFSTELGVRVAEFFMMLFPCSTKSRQVVNFSVCNEFLYFRMYRYCFSFSNNGPIFEKIGPHLSLRLWRYIEYKEGEKVVNNYENYIKKKCLL